MFNQHRVNVVYTIPMRTLFTISGREHDNLGLRASTNIDNFKNGSVNPVSLKTFRSISGIVFKLFPKCWDRRKIKRTPTRQFENKSTMMKFKLVIGKIKQNKNNKSGAIGRSKEVGKYKSNFYFSRPEKKKRKKNWKRFKEIKNNGIAKGRIKKVRKYGNN